MAILTVNNIKKMFGTDTIIENISFEVPVSYTHLTLPTNSLV